MGLLHIYDSSDWRIRQTAGQRGVLDVCAISNGNELEPRLNRLRDAGFVFDRILFETHGSPGRIDFGRLGINAAFWQNARGRWNDLTAANARIYFNGCNVAEGNDGWAFLEAAAGAFMTSGGGEVFGQTSVGFGNPFNGHVVHLWGSTRRLFVDNYGRIVEHFEQ
jgi:hypothetical protein